MNRHALILFVIIAGVISVTHSAERILNHASPKTVYDIAFERHNIWVATSGGLFWYDMSLEKFFVRPSDATFPDPSIRTLAIDAQGRVWAGSHEGYLVRRDLNGAEYLNRAYESAGWKIRDIEPYRDYLIIGSDKGVSLYDTRKNVVVKNSSKIGTFTSSQVNVIKVFKNRLYIGCELGLAVLNGKVEDIAERNFYDPSIWKIDTSFDGPVVSLVADSVKITPYSTPAGVSNWNLVTGDANAVTAHLPDDEESTIFVPSNITCIRTQNQDQIWIGTESDYCYFWGEGRLVPFILGGASFSGVSRILIDREGALWAMPFGNPNYRQDTITPWWLGINRYASGAWEVFSPKDYPAMGHMGGEGPASGLFEDTYGSIWFGIQGTHIKEYNSNNKNWYHYCNYAGNVHDGVFYKTQGACADPDWGKCDAFAQDSSGYLWFSSYNNDNGCLICYKPSHDNDTLTGIIDSLNGYYRRHPPYAGNGSEVNITAIAADPYGNIIYGTDKGRLVVAKIPVNPLKTDIVVVKTFSGLPKVTHIEIRADGSSLVLTSGGVYQLDTYNNNAMELTLNEDFDKNITALSLESETIYWYGTSTEGLVRYDLGNDEKTYYNKASGLVSAKINDVVVDEENGRVWVATDRGVSQIELGYSKSAATKGAELVYPNPYSFRRHTLLYFQNMPAKGNLRIYSLDGTLVGKPEMLRSGDDGAFYTWKPDASCAPGTYIYTCKSNSIKTNGKLMLVP